MRSELLPPKNFEDQVVVDKTRRLAVAKIGMLIDADNPCPNPRDLNNRFPAHARDLKWWADIVVGFTLEETAPIPYQKQTEPKTGFLLVEPTLLADPVDYPSSKDQRRVCVIGATYNGIRPPNHFSVPVGIELEETGEAYVILTRRDKDMTLYFPEFAVPKYRRQSLDDQINRYQLQGDLINVELSDATELRHTFDRFREETTHDSFSNIHYVRDYQNLRA